MSRKTKSLEYVRPQPGTFNLLAFPGFEFSFRKISIDDEAWVEETFGKGVWEMINQERAKASELCRLYFHFLTVEGKQKFPPEEVEVTDYEMGGVKKELLTGPRLFMRSIDGGTNTEMIMISQAFVKTVFASRPIDDLDEDLKKSLLKILAKTQSQEQEKSP